MSTPSDADRFRFGPFELCIATGELCKGTEKIKLQPLPFRLLVLFISRPGELITREEIQGALWSDGTTVEFDQSLNYCIRQIRAALDDDAREPVFIETVPKRGYRFAAAVDRMDSIAVESPSPSPTDLVTAPRPHTRTWVALLAVMVLTLAGAGGLWIFVRASAPRVPKQILVRPFVGLGLAPEDAWLGDALTQQLIGTLANSKALHVIPWSASLALKGQNISAREAGRRFQVDAILEGSVRYANGRLHVAAQLVDVASERTLWSHQDERDALDLGLVQDEIVADIADTLKLRLAEAATPAARRRPADLETYNLYLKADYLAASFSGEAVDQSLNYYREVIRRAPDYAPAYAGLANAQVSLTIVGQKRVAGMLDKGCALAQQAIDMDDSLVLGHAALAHCLWQEWKWKAAEKEFRKALSLDPDSVVAHHLYALFLVTQGRADEAIAQGRKAVELAPTSPLIGYTLANVLLHAGRYEEAVSESRKVHELQPTFALAYSALTRAYVQAGRTQESFDALRDWGHLELNDVQPLWQAYALAKSGQGEQARLIIDNWLRADTRPRRKGVVPLAVAVARLAVGDRTAALDAIDRSITLHTPSIIYLKVTPELEPLHSEPRFQAALARMDLD